MTLLKALDGADSWSCTFSKVFLYEASISFFVRGLSSFISLDSFCSCRFSWRAAISIASCLMLFSFSAFDFSFSTAFSRDLSISAAFSLLKSTNSLVLTAFSTVDFNFSLIFHLL